MRWRLRSAKLRGKMMAGFCVILPAALSVCCMFMITTCKKTILKEAETYICQENTELCDTIYRQVTTLLETPDPLARITGVRYLFSEPARSAPAGNEYVLMQGKESIYNNSGIDVAAVLGEIPDSYVDGQKAVCKMIRLQEQDYLVSGVVMRPGDEEFLVSVVRDMTDSMDMVRTLAVRCIFICAGITVAAVWFTFFFLKRSLSPIEQLDENAKRIVAGEYGCRIDVKRQDELGTLGESFNTMAQSVEQHILQVETVAKDQNMLLHALAHEMRTPVTAISGYAYALQYARLSEEQKKEAVAFMESESLRLERLTKKITELVHMDSDQIERREISVAELFEKLQQVEHSMHGDRGHFMHGDRGSSPQADEEHAVSYVYDEGTYLFGDFDLLLMLLTNLLDNAYKAGANQIEVSCREGVLAVSDNGQGILPEQMEKIMQPFYQGDFSRNRQGFGLGLALCTKIASLHGTELLVRSTPGSGSTFSVNLNNSFTCL